MITRQKKDAVIADLRDKITNSRAMFLTNVIGLTANDTVELRKKVREANGALVVTRNTLFGKAAEGTYAEEALKGGEAQPAGDTPASEGKKKSKKTTKKKGGDKKDSPNVDSKS